MGGMKNDFFAKMTEIIVFQRSVPSSVERRGCDSQQMECSRAPIYRDTNAKAMCVCVCVCVCVCDSEKEL